MNKLCSFVLLSTLLTGCGGGGSESSAVKPPASNVFPVTIQSQPVVTEFSLEESKPIQAGVVIESAAQTSHEIAVPDGFALNSERSFNLKITRSDDDNQAGYLSLCSDYQQYSDGTYSINYDSCLLRIPLNDNNSYEAVITVTNDTEGLVAALWFLDESKEPIITDWRF